jgi:hypothetical protein
MTGGCGFDLGDRVSHDGRSYEVFGFTHAGTDEPYVVLKGASGEGFLTLPLAALEADPNQD